jgi:hypothetical protein
MIVFEGLTQPACLEALAVREALALAADLNVRNCLIASDYLEVIKGIEAGSMGPYSNILQEITGESRGRGGVSFCHESRRSNQEAHSMARLATSLGAGRHVWFLDPPEGLNIPVNNPIM